MKREEGWYWVKAKQDAESQSDFSVLMGLCTPNDWTPAKWYKGSFEIGHYNMEAYRFDIDENRIPSPAETLSSAPLIHEIRVLDADPNTVPRTGVIEMRNTSLTPQIISDAVSAALNTLLAKHKNIGI